MEARGGMAEQPIPLTERPIPAINHEQLAKFSLESLHAKKEDDFDVVLPEGRSVVAVDLGGDSFTASVFQVVEGELSPIGVLADKKEAKGGQGYLTEFERVAGFARARKYPVGISFAGPIEGTRPQDGPNMPIFMSEFRRRYNGDFANLFPESLILDNDAPAGLKRGKLQAEQHGLKDVIYVINGSGLNAAVLLNGSVFALESGHIEVVDELNPFGQQQPCQVFGAQYVCMELVAANKAGIESLWQKRTGQELNGKGIEAEYLRGSRLAADLYDNSALVTAHMVEGVAKAFNIDLAAGATAIVGHGGTFRFPHYGDRLQQILAAHAGAQPPLFMTKDFSSNACLEGVALAALAKSA